MHDSDSPKPTRRYHQHHVAMPAGKRMDDIFKRPVYKTGDGDYKYFQRPGSDTAYKLPSRGLR